MMTRMTIRMSMLLLGGLLFGDAQALAVAPASAVDPREETALQGQPQVTLGAQPPAAAERAQPSAPAESVLSGNPLWAIPLRQLSATRERPLFAPSRRPPPVVATTTYQLASVPPPAPPRPLEPERPQLSLVGTVAGEAGGIGVFLDQAGKTVLRLKTGENHKGWVLRSVNGRSVVLAKGFAIVELTLPAPDLTKSDGPPQPGFAQGASAAPRGTAGSMPGWSPSAAAATTRPPTGASPAPAGGLPITFKVPFGQRP
jgi:general secretion pathway protein N